jgi:hypothetical protein
MPWLPPGPGQSTFIDVVRRKHGRVVTVIQTITNGLALLLNLSQFSLVKSFEPPA